MATYVGHKLRFTKENGDEYILEGETYESKSAQSGGTDVSLVTTGEKYTWNSKTSNTGTVTRVETGVGLTGGPITGNGTVKANLKSETFAEHAASDPTNVDGRQYPIVPDADGKLSVNVPWESSSHDTTYTLTQDATDGHRITLTPSSGSPMSITIPDENTTYESKVASQGGTEESLVTTGEKFAWSNKADPDDIPTKVSDLLNDAGYLTQHQDITGKMDKLSGGVYGNFTSIDSNGNLMDSGYQPSSFITSHQDISGKADKVANASNGNFAALDANGNLRDSGHKHSDYLTSHQDISGKMNLSLKGAANGVAELDSSGKVPSTQLPSYVDDVVEYNSTSSFPLTGESGKIYVATDTNKTYRWSGSTYVEIGGGGVALGETSSTAYRGDRGKAAYDHALAKGSAFSSGLYKITTNAEGHVIGVELVTKQDIVDLGIPSTNTNTTYSLTQDATDGHKITLTPSSGNPTTITIPDNNTTYSSKTAASGGADVSLVTTGEKYTWNNKFDKTGGDITGNIRQINTGIDASKADNGVSSTQWPTTMNINDKDGRILTRMEGIIDPNGDIAAYWYARNYNTSGQQVAQKGIKISMNKSGVMTYTVDEGDKFRSAIGAADTSTSLSLTASASGWSSDGTITLTASGVTASNNISVGVGSGATAEQYAAAAVAQIMCTAQAANSITLTAFGTVPEVDIPITVMIFG